MYWLWERQQQNDWMCDNLAQMSLFPPPWWSTWSPPPWWWLTWWSFRTRYFLLSRRLHHQYSDAITFQFSFHWMQPAAWLMVHDYVLLRGHRPNFYPHNVTKIQLLPARCHKNPIVTHTRFTLHIKSKDTQQTYLNFCTFTFVTIIVICVYFSWLQTCLYSQSLQFQFLGTVLN